MGNNMFVASINNNTVTLSCDYIDTQKTKKAFTDSALSQYQTLLFLRNRVLYFQERIE